MSELLPASTVSVRVLHTRDTNYVLTFSKEMETCFSEIFFWIVVFGIIGWMLKLLAFKIWNTNKLQAVVRGQIIGDSFLPTCSNQPQENDEQNLRKEPGENDERESWKEPQENDERFA